MLQITNDFKNKVVEALASARQKFEGSDSQFAKRWGMAPAIYSRLKGGEREQIIKDAQWLNMGRELGVSLNERKWNAARTDVFNQIEEEVLFCKKHAKAMIFVDECEIGKTFTAKYLARTVKNCFYVDVSQSKNKTLLVRHIAKVLGVDDSGRVSEVKANIKYYLRMIDKPVVIVDEPGDLEYGAFLDLKEFWNGTEGACGWYLIGADGLREKMNRGIRQKKVGYRELFSRFSSNYSHIVPTDRQQRIAFYRKLITEVISANIDDAGQLAPIVRKCLTSDDGGNIGGLRRAESLLILTREDS